MFKMFERKSKDSSLYAIAEGRLVNIEDVPDPMFAQKLLGDGIAFDFSGDVIYAPCDGVVIMIAATKHAIGIKADNGAEILIHIGLDTVNFSGQGFTLLVKEQQKVKRGQALVKVDQPFFKENNVNLITPMIITSQNYRIETIEAMEVDLRQPVILFKP